MGEDCGCCGCGDDEKKSQDETTEEDEDYE